MAPFTALDGTLVRHGPDDWRWRDDGARAPVTDLTEGRGPNRNFRCRTYSGGETYVEVPRGAAREDEDLRWVLAGARSGRYQGGLDGDRAGPIDILTGRPVHVRPGRDPIEEGADAIAPGPIPAVVLVPIAEYEEWAGRVCGCEWDRAAEPTILSRAYALGWRPPADWTAPSGWRAPEASP